MKSVGVMCYESGWKTVSIPGIHHLMVRKPTEGCWFAEGGMYHPLCKRQDVQIEKGERDLNLGN